MPVQTKIEKELLYYVVKLTDASDDEKKLEQIENIRKLLKNLENKIVDKKLHPYKSDIL